MTIVICLIEATVELTAKDGAAKLVEGGTDATSRPLAKLKPRHYSGTAKSLIKYRAIDTSSLGTLDTADSNNNFELEEFGSEHEAINSEVLLKHHSDLVTENLSLPSLPAVAMRVCELINNADVDVDKLARTTNTDPAIAADLIRAANSPPYRGQSPIDQCDNAVVRLGLQTSRQLVSSFAVNELFNSDSPLLEKRTGELWRHSTEIAAISYVIASKTKTLAPEQPPLLVGILHDIGALPLLTYSQNVAELADDPAALEAFLVKNLGRIGTVILEKWDFPRSLVCAIESCDDWLRGTEDPSDYADVVIIAQLHSFIGTDSMPDIPPMDELPAFRKLAGNGLSPNLSVEIIHKAKQEIEQVRELLSS